jgi:hypothetical protein
VSELVRHVLMHIAAHGIPGFAGVATFLLLAPLSSEVTFEQSSGEGLIGHAVTVHRAVIGPDSMILAVIAGIVVFILGELIADKAKS